MNPDRFRSPHLTPGLLMAALLALSPGLLVAGPGGHAEEDAFALEAARLLPAPPPRPPSPPPLPTDRITQGDWSSIIAWTPHIPVSAATLPDGRILTFASNQRTTFPNGPEFTYAATWDPASGVFVEYNNTNHDMFCGGIVMLPDGRVIVNGGRNVTVRSSIFDWRSNTWTRVQDMNDGRWYNTSVALPNGRVFTASGSGGYGTVERWEAATGWSRLPGIDWTQVTAEPGYINIWHPFLLVAQDGRLLHFGPTRTMQWVSTDGTGVMTDSGAVVPGDMYPKEGSWAMYDPGRILVAGGGTNTTENATDSTTGTSSTLAYTVDVRSGAPVVAMTGAMRYARQFANAVILPNGEVMVMGGNTSGLKFNDTGSIYTPEIWNPATGQWRTVADMAVPRNYHSLALLLPDGRVLSAGGGLGGNSADHRDAQIFTPPNLWQADGTPAVRPVITTAPGLIGVGTQFPVTATPGIRRFAFIKLSALTHSVNTDLRSFVPTFIESSPGNYTLTVLANLNVMTPGYWMLFAVDAAGVHSTSKIIQVDKAPAVQITSPGSQFSYIGQAVSLKLTGTGPVGATLAWSATGLPPGLTIDPATGIISGTPTTVGRYLNHFSMTDGFTTSSVDVSWNVQAQTFNANYAGFSTASGFTFSGRAGVFGSVIRLTANTASQNGAAFLTSPVAISADASISTRFVFRISGTANGGEGLAFVIQGTGSTALGTAGGGLGYEGIAKSLAVEVDNNQGTGDPNGNHLGVLANGVVTNHLATWTPSWDLENEQSQTVWVDYDGPANQLRVYAAQGNTTQRPPAPVLTVDADLPGLVGNRAWIGFTAATGTLANNHDIEAWSVTVNAFALPSPPVVSAPGNLTNVVNTPVTWQLLGTDPNGDAVTWSATGLPPGLTVNPATGLISGTPTVTGTFNPVVTASDGNTPAASLGFLWQINDPLTVAPLSGFPVAVGSPVAVSAVGSGGVNLVYQWNFGDGTAAPPPSPNPRATHTYAAPGRYLVTVTVSDDTQRTLTSSYRQGVYAAPTARRPVSSSSIVYEDRPGANARVWAVNPDNDSVSVIDVVTRTRVAEIPVGASPRTLSLAPDGRIWVASTEGASLTVLRPDLTPAQLVPLPRGSRPFGIVADPGGNWVYVALEHGGRILRLSAADGTVTGSLAVGLHVRHLALTADGGRLLASRFITPPIPGENTASPQTTVNGVNYGGEVVVVDTATFTQAGVVVLQHGEQPDTSNSAHGIPNYLGAPVISPDGQSAWVPSKQDNIKRGLLRNGGELTHDMSMRSIASRIVLPGATEELAGRIDFDNAGVASASAFDPTGLYLFTALEGNRQVVVADAWARHELLRFDAGRAPQGVVVSPDGRSLFVHNFMDRSITIHDLTTLVAGSEALPPAPTVVSCVAQEKLSPAVLTGKQLFYDTADPRLAFQGYISCASCHNDGDHDGRVWDFTQFGEGLRNTIILRGHGGTAQGPLHWTGNFDEVQDFEGQIRAFAQGTGLMSDADFHAGTRSLPLGDPKSGLSADLDALAAYVGSLSRNGDSPERNPDGSLTAAALAGQGVFQQRNCVQCHSGVALTDSALGLFHDIGTLRPSSGQRLGAPLTGLDTPTLRGLWSTAPYLHDGSAATLEAAVLAHQGVTLTAGDLASLTAYLRQLDDSAVVSPAVVQWSPPADVLYGTPLSGAQLNARATVSGSFTYTPPLGTRLAAGAGQVLSVTFRPDDTANYSPATVTVPLNVQPVPLGIRADDKTRATGSPNPSFTATYTGFVSGEDASVLSPAVAFTTSATASSPAGSYPIVASGAGSPNYAITYTAGTLTVTGGSGPVAVSNPAAITIPLSGNATPYASPIVVSGLTGRITRATVSLVGVTHTYLSDIDVVLVGPQGQSIVLMSDVGGSQKVSGMNLDFDDAAPSSVPQTATVAPGVYKPTNYDTTTDFFPSPAPALNYANTLGTLVGASPNGTWTLFVRDDSGGDQGSIAGGWSVKLLLSDNTPPTVSAPLDQSVVVGGTVGPLAFTVGDVETPALSLVVAATSSDTVLIPAAGIVLGGSGAARTVSVTPAPSATGTATVTLTVTDQGGASTSAGFKVTVNSGATTSVTFTAPATITIPSSGKATPYPSSLVVSGVAGVVGTVSVQLTGITHTYPADIDIALVGPTGAKSVLMSDAGGSRGVTGLNLVFEDAATQSLPATTLIAAGRYRPTDFEPGDVFYPPAPAGPYAAGLGVFTGTNPNGTWSLYVVDDSGGDAGSISGGWALTLTTGTPPAPPVAADRAPDLKLQVLGTAGGGVDLVVSGATGGGYRIEHSEDLFHWTALTQGTLGAGAARVSDGSAPKPGVRFYRLSQLP